MSTHRRIAYPPPTTLAATAHLSGLLAAVLVSVLGLISATSGDAQADITITLCCDSVMAHCSPASGSGGASVMTAQTPCPDPTVPGGVIITIPGVSASVCSGGTCTPQVTTYKTEPQNGFVGVCLAPSLSYQPTLPTVCYSVKMPNEPNHGYAVVSAPAKDVYAPYGGTLDSPFSKAYPDSYQTLLACYPHNAHGNCPCPTRTVSHSCCELGSHMTSLDKRVARGYSTMPQASAPQAQCNCLSPDPNDSNNCR